MRNPWYCDKRVEDRDYFAEGVEAAILGKSDVAPDDVVESGIENEASWNDGYASVIGYDGDNLP